MMKITGLSHLFKWENLHNWWLTKYFFAPLYIEIYHLIKYMVIKSCKIYIHQYTVPFCNHQIYWHSISMYLFFHTFPFVLFGLRTPVVSIHFDCMEKNSTDIL